MNRSDAAALAAVWKDKRVGVLGDLMLDRYVWGDAKRISQEAPIPVVAVKRTTARPGGAANVLLNLTTLGAQAHAFGAVGLDPAGDELTNQLSERGISSKGVVIDAARRTTEKTRILAGNQQVVRVDVEQTDPLEGDAAAVLARTVLDALAEKSIDALILEDYAKGVLGSDLLVQVLKTAREHDVPVAMDPHPANRFATHGLTLMTPNRAEAFALAGHYDSDPIFPIAEDQSLGEVAQTLNEDWEVENLLITLGSGGMALFRKDREPHHIPTRAQEVFDVSGAGDTVISSFVLALLAGATPEDAAVVSNHAAGVVVGKVGTAPCALEELLGSFDEAS